MQSEINSNVNFPQSEGKASSGMCTTTQGGFSCTQKGKITTRELAKRFGVLATSINRSVCLKGHWQGLIPDKAPNGRCYWDDVYPQDVAI